MQEESKTPPNPAAEAKKNEGNAEMKKGNFAAAIKLYTEALGKLFCKRD